MTGAPGKENPHGWMAWGRFARTWVGTGESGFTGQVPRGAGTRAGSVRSTGIYLGRNEAVCVHMCAHAGGGGHGRHAWLAGRGWDLLYSVYKVGGAARCVPIQDGKALGVHFRKPWTGAK